ncbi:MAG: acetate kinase [Firmicutes bacterium GWF2_51_9]|nr:MAG: acetate kinase [Firmicutes bacterium GWF2_51_9]OGS57889.1 MAG: acetate kinase [Firmicutes bacterium GWE2_51_13]
MSLIMSLNSGSSSLKFQVFRMPAEVLIASGLIERIGLPSSVFTVKANDHEESATLDIPNHKEAIRLVLESLKSHGIVSDLKEIAGIGHRIVHGGEKYSASVVINEQVEKDIELLSDLAPLHNPANLLGVRVIDEILPEAVQVAVFDTAFHQTMEPISYMYPLPYEYYEKYGIRKYGFHGTSHGYVTKRLREILGSENSRRIISCHLGNGGSLAAVKNGKCVNTTMGFTPLAGIMMGTRSGDIDPSILAYLSEKEHLSLQGVTDLCNKKSGLLGVSGISSDMRDIENAIKDGNARAKLACDMYVQRVCSTIAAYAVQLGGVDAILFTAGIGENSIYLRQLIIETLEDAFPIELDRTANNIRRKEAKISTTSSRIQVWVIPTNEELVIARDTYRLMK